MGRKRCEFLINRHHNKPTPTSPLRGPVVGFCVMEHLEVWPKYDCGPDCIHYKAGSPIQTMEEYEKDWKELPADDGGEE